MRFRLDPLAPNGLGIEPEITVIKESAGFAVPGRDGRVQSVVAGTNVTVDSTDPANPIVSSSGSGGSGISRLISIVSTNTDAGSTASTDYVYFVTSPVNITLPDAMSNTNLYTVTNVSAGTVTVLTTNSQTINGSSSATIPIENMSLDFVSDGDNWSVI